MKVKVKSGKMIKLGRTQPKKSLAFWIVGLTFKLLIVSLCMPRNQTFVERKNKPTNTKWKSIINQVFDLQKNFFKK